MAVDITRTPFPVRYRELWLPRAINGNASLPSSRYNGHGLTLTGARLGSTCDGVHFDGSATSNINCGAIHNNAATFWLKFRFKLDQDFSSAATADQYLWGKFLDATHFLWLVLKAADGKLYFEGQDGGVNDFSIAAQDGATDITSWNAGQWYTVLASISAANNIRFIIDGGTVVTNASAIAFPNGGDFIVGDYDDPGAGTGFKGVIVDFVDGTDDLTTDEETDLYKGIPPADAVNVYLLDEGRGTTAYDRGSGGNNGTLDSSCTWAFGQVEQPVLSLDGINDYATATSVDIGGDLSIVWVGKMKSIYDSLMADHYFYRFRLDAGNDIYLYYRQSVNDIRYSTPNISDTHISVVKPAIDDYWIIIATLTQGEGKSLYLNGYLTETDTGTGRVAGFATAYIGRTYSLANYDISKPLFIALIDGAFTKRQVLVYSRWLKDVFNLPISI